MANRVDKIDIKIIELLAKNARMTYKELAETLGTTRQRISRRMDKLERIGIIKKYTIVPDYDRLGYSHVVLGITLKAGVDVDEIARALTKMEDIKIVQKALGAHHIVAHIIAPKEMKEIQRIINEISKNTPGIEHIDVTFITEDCKHEIF